MNVRPDVARKHDGWAPVAAYGNGGRVVGQQRFTTMEQALLEASEYVACVIDHPNSFRHPDPHQCIELE